MFREERSRPLRIGLRFSRGAEHHVHVGGDPRSRKVRQDRRGVDDARTLLHSVEERLRSALQPQLKHRATRFGQRRGELRLEQFPLEAGEPVPRKTAQHVPPVRHRPENGDRDRVVRQVKPPDAVPIGQIPQERGKHPRVRRAVRMDGGNRLGAEPASPPVASPRRGDGEDRLRGQILPERREPEIGEELHRFPVLEKAAAVLGNTPGHRGQRTLPGTEPDPVEGEERKPHAAKGTPPGGEHPPATVDGDAGEAAAQQSRKLKGGEDLVPVVHGDRDAAWTHPVDAGEEEVPEVAGEDRSPFPGSHEGEVRGRELGEFPVNVIPERPSFAPALAAIRGQRRIQVARGGGVARERSSGRGGPEEGERPGDVLHRPVESGRWRGAGGGGQAIPVQQVKVRIKVGVDRFNRRTFPAQVGQEHRRSQRRFRGPDGGRVNQQEVRTGHVTRQRSKGLSLSRPRPRPRSSPRACNEGSAPGSPPRRS